MADRNRDLAEALGFEDRGGEREVIVDDQCVGSDWDEYWHDPNGDPINALPDFSTPEWQERIREKVREKWVETYQYVRVNYTQDYVHLTLVSWSMKEQRWESRFHTDAATESEAWTSALLWLHRQKEKV